MINTVIIDHCGKLFWFFKNHYKGDGMSKVYQLGGIVAAGVLMAASMVMAQGMPIPDPTEENVGTNTLDDYCGNMGTVKSISAEQIVIDGMNWDFESDSETVEETYMVDPNVKIKLDGYVAYSDIKEGDFIGVECEKKSGKMLVTLIQSESAIDKAFGDANLENGDQEQPMDTDQTQLQEQEAPASDGSGSNQ